MAGSRITERYIYIGSTLRIFYRRIHSIPIKDLAMEMHSVVFGVGSKTSDD